MKLFQAYCNAAYYNEFDSSSLLSDIQSYINPSISELNKEFQFIFYKMLHSEPCSY